MAEGMTGMATSVPVAVSAPVHDSIPVIPNTGFMVPEEIWTMFDVADHRITQSTRGKEQMRNIIGYFWEQHQGGDINDVMLGIREAMNTFAAPTFNTNRFEQMAQFVNIQRQINSLQKKKSALTNGQLPRRS